MMFGSIHTLLQLLLCIYIVLVSTRQVNTGDSTSSNAGFRCANSYKDKSNNVKSGTMSTKKNKVTNDDIINLDL